MSEGVEAAASGLGGLKSLRKTERMPVLFLGHGSPMNAIEDNGYRRSWQACFAFRQCLLLRSSFVTVRSAASWCGVVSQQARGLQTRQSDASKG